MWTDHRMPKSVVYAINPETYLTWPDPNADRSFVIEGCECNYCKWQPGDTPWIVPNDAD